MALTGDARLARWMADVEARHLADLTPPEVARALRALSSTYVERRARLTSRGAFDSAGKRAAYALYYAPRRWYVVDHILRALGTSATTRAVLDLGCGTGVAGAAWALTAPGGCAVTGVDLHPWALDEARATYRALGVDGQARRAAADSEAIARFRRTRKDAPTHLGIVASYTVNELADDAREELRPALLAAAANGVRVLVVEPLSRRASPWWPSWAAEVVAAGGRADEWRLRAELPEVTRALGRAAGLTVAELTARTLSL